jgi:hypothetical protein
MTTEITDLETREEIVEKKPGEVEVQISPEEKPTRDLKSKDPRENEPPKDSPRFKDVYGKWKGTERELEAEKKARANDRKVMEEMVKHNKELAGAMKKIADKPVAAPQPEEDKVGKLEEKLSGLLDKRAQARKDLEHDKVDSIQDEIADLKLDIRDAKREAKEKAKAPEPKKDDIEVDPAITQFVSEHPWFETDSVMKAAAIAIDNELVGLPEWANKSTNERMKEVAKKVEERFNHKPERQAPPAGAVENGDGPKPTGRKSVKLNETELELAAGFGITPEDYAAQKDAIKELGL